MEDTELIRQVACSPVNHHGSRSLRHRPGIQEYVAVRIPKEVWDEICQRSRELRNVAWASGYD